MTVFSGATMLLISDGSKAIVALVTADPTWPHKFVALIASKAMYMLGEIH